MKARQINLVCSIATMFACSLFWGCNKQQEFFYIDPDIKYAFSTFKKGSYWIYEDSVTGKIDSFAIVANAGTRLKDDGNGYMEEIGGFGMTEYGYTSVGKDTVNWTILIHGHNSHLNISCERPGKAQSPAVHALNAPGVSIPKEIQVSILPTLTIYGNVFKNVTLSTSSDNSVVNKDYICVNYDPGILVVKQTHPYFNRTLKLVRWHIVR